MRPPAGSSRTNLCTFRRTATRWAQATSDTSGLAGHKPINKGEARSTAQICARSKSSPTSTGSTAEGTSGVLTVQARRWHNASTRRCSLSPEVSINNNTRVSLDSKELPTSPATSTSAAVARSAARRAKSRLLPWNSSR